jgi:plasmid stabilization system protein ParE
MIVRITDEADANLEVIGDEIAKDNPDRAVTFVRELRESCLGLAEFPERFPLVARYETKGVRRRLHGNYLIFYRVEPAEVVVVNVLHGAQDYAAILLPQ